jgi:hypothetical protein
VTMNAEGARIERRLGRPILARLHAAASAGMAIGSVLGSLIAASVAPWTAGLIAALGGASAALAYDRAARNEGDAQPVKTHLAFSGLSFSGSGSSSGYRSPPKRRPRCGPPCSCEPKHRSSPPSRVLARRSSHRLPGDASLQRKLRPAPPERSTHHHRIICDRRGGFRLSRRQSGVRPQRGGLRPHRHWHRGHRPLRLCACRAPVRDAAGGRPFLRLVVQRPDEAPRSLRDRAIAQNFSLPAAFGACARALPRGSGHRCNRAPESVGEARLMFVLVVGLP